MKTILEGSKEVPKRFGCGSPAVRSRFSGRYRSKILVTIARSVLWRWNENMSQSARSVGLRGLTRYDLVLLLIPLTFLVATAAGVSLDAPPHVVTAVGGVASALVLVDALFRNPPLSA
jgi:hypothetical protein